MKSLKKVADSLFTSKLRYGLQLLGCVRWVISDPITQAFEDIQKCQNKLVRLINGTKISDKINAKS